MKKGVELKENQFDLNLWMHYHYFLSRAILVAGASVFLILVGVIPMISRFKQTRVALTKEKEKLETLSQKVVVLDNLDLRILKDRLELVNRVLPPSKNVVIYLNTLDLLAKELGLSLGDVSLSPGLIYEKESKQTKKQSVVKGKEKWQTLETEVRIIGSQENIYAFLRRVEGLAPLMVIKDVQVSRVEEGSDNFILSLKLGMIYAEPKVERIVGQQIKLLSDEDERLVETLKSLRSYPLEVNTSTPTLLRNKADLFKPAEGVRSTNQSLESHQTEIQTQSLESSQSAQMPVQSPAP